MFIMSEVATIIFEETPLAFGKDIRSGRYQRTHTTDPGVIRQVAALGAPSESSAGGSVGVTLYPSVVLACLVDRRRSELVVPFKTPLIAVASSEAAPRGARAAPTMRSPWRSTSWNRRKICTVHLRTSTCSNPTSSPRGPTSRWDD